MEARAGPNSLIKLKVSRMVPPYPLLNLLLTKLESPKAALINPFYPHYVNALQMVWMKGITSCTENYNSKSHK